MPDGEYYEVHYMLEEGGDVEFVSSFKGRPMRSHSTAVKCMDSLKRKFPNAVMWDIGLYDNSGRID